MPAEPEAVGPARRRLRQLLTLWGTDADVVDDALLLARVVTAALGEPPAHRPATVVCGSVLEAAGS